MTTIDLAKFQGNDPDFDRFLPGKLKDFNLQNIAETALLATASDTYHPQLVEEIADCRDAMTLLLNALPELIRDPSAFRTYRNSQVTPVTGGFLRDWGRIRLCLHGSDADTTGIPHRHHTGYGDETAPVASVQIETRAELMMEVSHRVAEAHGGAYLFTIDSVWDEKKQKAKEMTSTNMHSPFVRTSTRGISVKEGDFYALGSQSQHTVTRKGFIPNWMKPFRKPSLSVFMMLLKPERAHNNISHQLNPQNRMSLWSELVNALNRHGLTEDKASSNEETTPIQ